MVFWAMMSLTPHLKCDPLVELTSLDLSQGIIVWPAENLLKITLVWSGTQVTIYGLVHKELYTH